MKSTTSALSAPFVLKVIGYTLLVSTIIIYLTFLIPLQWQDDQWVFTTVPQLFDRGMMPLIGIGFIYMSSFLETGSLRAEGRNPFLTGRFFAVVLSGLLGLGFLIAGPAYFVKSTQLETTGVDRLAQQAKQQEQQIAAQVQQRLMQLQEQVKDKTKLDAELKQIGDVITSGQMNGKKIEGKELEFLQKSQKDLQKLKDDPNYLQVMAKDATDQELQKLREGAKKTEDGARGEAMKARLRTGLGSLLYAIAFSLISWLGLAEMGVFSKR